MRLVASLVAAALAFPAAAQDIVPWKTFAEVQVSKTKDGIVPQFSASLAALDQKEVTIRGFMLPLESGEKHVFFILSAVPPTCSFCMPGGPEAVVEVRAKRGLPYTESPIEVRGRLSVLKNDPTGIFYRLSDAVATK